jgi:hypothetical protein
MSELRDNPEDNPEVVHEESDVDVGAILRWGAALAVVALIVHVFLYWLVGVYTRQAEQARTLVYPLATGQSDDPLAGLVLQRNPQQDMRELRARQEAQLERYEWVNEEAGIARVPIEDAMRIVVERGLPAREAEK